MNYSKVVPYKIKFAIPVFLLLLIACGNKRHKKDQDVVHTSNIQIAEGCYRMIISTDTAYMNLKIAGDSFSAQLNYAPAKNVKTEGMFTGSILKDTLMGWYSFNTSDLVSVRQIKMLATKDGFAEGYGDYEPSNDTAYFKYPFTLNFEKDNPFKKVNCP